MFRVMMAVVLVISTLHNPAFALSKSDKEALENCVQSIANKVKTLRPGSYTDFAESVIDYDNLIRVADSDPGVQRGLKVQTINTILGTRTIPALQNHDIADLSGRINYKPVRVRIDGEKKHIGWRMTGTADGTEVQLDVTLGGEYGCRLFNAQAVRVTLSNLVKNAFEKLNDQN